MINLAKAVIRGLLRASTLGLQKGPHVTRYVMYRRLTRFRCLPSEEMRALSISNSMRLCNLLGFPQDQVVNVTFPEVSILALPFPDAAFDYVVSDQVLEHVEGDPYAAIDESFRVLKPGGIAVHTTCLINPIHNVPGDFWRFTPAALALLAERRSQVLEVGGWGNPFVWPYAWLGMRYDPIPHAPWHPLHWLATKNLRKWAICTWIVARKL